MPTINEIQATHTSAIAVLQRAVSGGKLSAVEQTEAADWLAGLSQIIARGLEAQAFVD
jgi:hypothetical protein